MSTVDPVVKALRIYAEADFVETLQWLHDGNPVDLAGHTIEGAIRRAYTDPTPAATFTVTMLNATLGLFEISLSETQTADLFAGVGVYDIRTTKAGLTQQLMRGSVQVYRSAT